jgi:hypothetical protein
MKTYGRLQIGLHAFLTSVLKVSGQLHAAATLPPDKEHDSLRGNVCDLGPNVGSRLVVPFSWLLYFPLSSSQLLASTLK